MKQCGRCTRRGQGAIEYLFLVGGVFLAVLIVILLVRNNLIPENQNRTQTQVNQYFDFINCANGNLVKNPSFEDLLNSAPRYWTGQGLAAGDGINYGDYYSGSKSVRITRQAGTTKNYSQNVSVRPSTNYVLSARWNGGNCSYVYGLEFAGTAPRLPSHSNGIKPVEASNWPQDSITFKTGADTDRLEVKIIVYGYGTTCTAAATTFFDAVCLYEQK